MQVHVASLNTRRSTELCLRTLGRFAGHPHTLVVGDGGSTDGSLEMLAELARESPFELQLAAQGRQHWEWLDLWRRECPARYAVFVDSDVEFRGRDWLADAVTVASRERAAMVTAEMLPPGPLVEPVGGKLVQLVERPAPWLLLLDIEQTRDIATSFEFRADHGVDVPGGIRAYDVGAAFYADVVERGLRVAQMPVDYRRKYLHYGGMSWRGGRRPRRILLELRLRYRLAMLR